MNEQLQSTIIDILKSAKQGIIDVAGYVQAQLPDLVRQILQWGAASSLFWIGIGTILIVIGWIFCALKKERWEGELIILLCMLGGILIIAGFLTVAGNVYVLIKISVAPKLYLIDYIKSLVAKGGIQ